MVVFRGGWAAGAEMAVQDLEGTLGAVSSQELLAPVFKRLAGCYALSMRSTTSKATVIL